MNKKITTIEDLAVIVRAGFRMMNEHFDRMEDERGGFKKELNEVDTRTAVIALQVRVSALEKKADVSNKTR